MDFFRINSSMILGRHWTEKEYVFEKRSSSKIRCEIFLGRKFQPNYKEEIGGVISKYQNTKQFLILNGKVSDRVKNDLMDSDGEIKS